MTTATIGLQGPAGPVGVAGAAGADGWSPVLAIVPDGERRVIQVSGWFGGAGDPPRSGDYIGREGFVSDIASGSDIRCPQGLSVQERAEVISLIEAYMAPTRE